MKKTPFILHETFHTENERQRRECFQQVFTRYIGGVYLNTLDTARAPRCYELASGIVATGGEMRYNLGRRVTRKERCKRWEQLFTTV